MLYKLIDIVAQIYPPTQWCIIFCYIAIAGTQVSRDIPQCAGKWASTTLEGYEYPEAVKKGFMVCTTFCLL